MDYKVEDGFRKRNIAYVTVLLVVVNALIFLVIDFGSASQNWEYIFNSGAMYGPVVFEGGEYYRLLTSMFLHWDYEHILNNMFMLAILGYQMEKEYGSIKFLVTYMVSGLLGNVLSGIIEMMTAQYSIGVGASGAVFGIFGAMLVLMFKNRKGYGQNYGPRLIILFILAVFGNMQEGVDWVAHFGGALTGVITAFALYRPKK